MFARGARAVVAKQARAVAGRAPRAPPLLPVPRVPDRTPGLNASILLSTGGGGGMQVRRSPLMEPVSIAFAEVATDGILHGAQMARSWCESSCAKP